MMSPKTAISRYVREKSAAIMVAFALIAPFAMGAAGMAVDYSHAYLVQQRLSQAIDAAALAAAASSTDAAEIEQRVQDFFEANYPEEKIGATIEPVVTVSENEIHVSAEAYYSTFFLNVIGIDDISVDVETTVQREVQGIEVVLVMDNTGSMASNNNIGALRTAAENFVNILFEQATHDEYIKIGLVPYSSSVNVGPYGLGEDLEGAAYGDTFMNNPLELEYNPGDSDEWHGCVLAADYPLDTEDHEGPWDMYRYCRDEDDDPVCDMRYNRRSRTYTARRSANYYCPETPLMPLTSDQEALLDTIDTMEADGYTYGNFGMVWGGRVISPEFPFEEGSDWDNEAWRKVVLMMTDGINTMHYYYSAYGPTDDHDISASDLNERFAEVCENLKEEGVIIYTVTFAGGVNENTKDYYRECASSEDQYYDAPSQDDLIDVFETISRELSNLHIKA